MSKYFVFIVLILTTVNIHSQTLIGTSYYPEATANHNQRKIIRDCSANIFIVFVDTNDQEMVIRGTMFDSSQGEWSDAINILYVPQGTKEQQERWFI